MNVCMHVYMCECICAKIKTGEKVCEREKRELQGEYENVNMQYILMYYAVNER